MSLFTKNKNINNPTTDISQPEYHNCPVCGSKIKTIPNVMKDYKEKYLDGQIKIPITTQLSLINECKNCGYLYYFNPETINNLNKYPTKLEAIKNILNSNEYETIKRTENISSDLKKLLQINELSKAGYSVFININQLWLDYYTEQNDTENIHKYLLKRIEEITKGFVNGGRIYPNQLVFETPSIFYISDNEILTDLYRRSKQFDKSKECINKAIEKYNFPSNTHPLKKYYDYGFY